MLEMPGHAWTVESLASIPTCPGQVLPSFSVMFPEPRRSCINKVASTNSGPDVFPGNVPVVVIAESVGYASESSFHKRLSASLVVLRENIGKGSDSFTLNKTARNQVKDNPHSGSCGLSTISISNGGLGFIYFFLMTLAQFLNKNAN